MKIKELFTLLDKDTFVRIIHYDIPILYVTPCFVSNFENDRLLNNTIIDISVSDDGMLNITIE